MTQGPAVASWIVVLSCFGSDPRADPQSMQPSLAVRGLGHGPAPCLCQRLGPSAAQQVLEGLQVLGLQVEEEGAARSCSDAKEPTCQALSKDSSSSKRFVRCRSLASIMLVGAAGRDSLSKASSASWSSASL